MESDLIRKKAFTSAQPHDSQLLDELLSADETTVFGESADSNKKDKQEARKKSKTRVKVERPFAYMEEKLNYRSTVALKNQEV